MTTEEASVRESDDIVSSAPSSCISEAVDDGDGALSSASSCSNEAAVGSEQSDDDRQLLCLLDAMDHLLCRREALAESLSKGWMEIASARYSMGPSRIDQALFSLKPSSASTLVSVSSSKDSVKVKSCFGEDDQENDSYCAFQYSLQRSSKNDRDNHIASKKENAHSNLRQRLSSGLEKKDHVDDSSEGSVDDDVRVNGRDMAQDRCTESKQRSDVLAWFGTLVSPHLRTAQTSFTEALEIVIELASTQSKILAAYQEIKQRRLI